MKTVSDALRLRSALINRLEEANLVDDAAVRGRLLTFVVVGGGYTGVETAGQMLDFLQGAKRLYPNLSSSTLRMVLVHSGPQLLPEIGGKLGDYARRVLEKQGTEVRLSVRASEVTATKVLLDDGSFIAANTVVSTVGNAPSPVTLDLCRQLGVEMKNGRLAVDATMRVPGQTHLWAAGDGALVPWNDRGTEKPSPPTAQFALRQGTQLGRNLARVLQGDEPQPFRHRYMGQLATVGERAAVAEIFGIRFSGFLAWWVWRTVYLAKLPGMLRRLRVMIDWTFDLFFSRDISIVLPPPEDVLRSIHLEAGELLVQRGDTVRAYYYVRNGSVRIEEAGGRTKEFPAGSVIDQQMIGADDCWRRTVVAAESSGITVFRGRALELLKTQLRLVPQKQSAESDIPAAERV
jgi:NADH dehydrogenase